MTRERWFYAQGHQRRGPVSLAQLVESILAQLDPRAVLVWRKGLAGWTRCEDLPEVERRIVLPSKTDGAQEGVRHARPAEPVALPAPARATGRGRSVLAYGALGVVVAVASLFAWLLWPRSRSATPPQPLPLGGTTAETAPAVVMPAPIPGVSPPGRSALGSPTRAPRPAGVGSREADLPSSETRKLRGVAVWSGDTLKLTVYNGTGWRLTELYVRIGRFKRDDLVEDPRPILLLPPDGQVDAGVDALMNRVAPDRKKPGLNPLDTGLFQGRVGQQPESFRWEIETARGYPPQ